MTAADAFGLDPRLLSFNLLPSRSLHATYWSRFALDAQAVGLDAGGLPAARLHRQVSRRILDELGLTDRPVVDAALPQWPLALLEGDALNDLRCMLGALLCVHPLRTSIRGEQVRVWHEDVGHEVIACARGWTRSDVPDYAATRNWDVARILTGYADLGAAALLRACAGGGEALVARLALKLPPVQDVEHLPSAAALLDLSLDILQERNPTWISSFPAIH